MSRVRVLYFGLPVEFSGPPLQRLIQSGAEVVAVVVPQAEAGGRTASLPADSLRLHSSALSLAAGNLPRYQAGRLNDPAVLAGLRAYRPDVICVACYNQIFPPALLALPPHGCLNLHPSLLPRYRGPAPLFWQFREGERETGVTVHFMDRGADTGDIALQRPLPFADGLSGQAADRLCAEAGGELMAEAVRRLGEGDCPRIPQSFVDARLVYAPWPAPADFVISASWPARRAYNFVRGTAEWGAPYEIAVGDERLLVRQAHSFSPEGVLGEPWRRQGRELAVQFSPGIAYFEAISPKAG